MKVLDSLEVDRYYRGSEEINKIFFGLSLFLMVIFSFILGQVYNTLLSFIGFVYLNFLICTIIALVLGYSVKFVSKIFKIRSYKKRLIVFYTSFTFFYYSQWVGFFIFALSGKPPTISTILDHSYLFWSIDYFFPIISSVYKYGVYEVFSIPINGWILILIWIVEFSILFFSPLIILKNSPIAPFSELQDKWYPKLILNYDFEYLVALDLFKTKIEKEGVLETVNSLKKGQAHRHSKLSIYYLKEENIQYIQGENIFIEKGGRGSAKSKTVLPFYKITSNDAQSLIEKYGTSKEFFLDY